MESNFKRSAQKFHIKILMILNNPFATDKVFHFDVLSSFLWNSIQAPEYEKIQLFAIVCNNY